MGTMVETDIDKFIKDQKAKLAEERQAVGLNVDNKSRGTWDKTDLANTKLAREPEVIRPTTPPEDSRLGAGNDNYQQVQKKALNEQRRKEYNELLVKKGLLVERNRRPPTPQETGLNIGRYEEKQRKLKDERHQDFLDLLAKQKPPGNRKLATPEGTVLPLGGYEATRKKLEKDRHEEYQAFIAKKPPINNRRPLTPDETGLPLSSKDDARRQLQIERQREYSEILAKKNASENRVPVQRNVNGDFLSKLGGYEQTKQKFRDERKQEMVKALSDKNIRQGHMDSRQAADYLAGLSSEAHNGYVPGGSSLGYEEDRRIRRPIPEADDDAHKQDNKVFAASIPGLSYSPSALQKRNASERNQEYNQFLRSKEVAGRSRSRVLFEDERSQGGGGPPGHPKKGWGTPTYDEMLEKKRQEEARYRRHDDTEYTRPGIRAYASEGALHQVDGDRKRDPDRDYDGRKVTFKDGDKQDLSKDDLDIKEEFKAVLSRLKRLELSKERERDDSHKQYLDEGPVRGYPSDNQRRRHIPLIDSEKEKYQATLLVGHEERDSAKQRKKDFYRKELELQMRDKDASRLLEKTHELRVNASGLDDPEKAAGRLRGLPAKDQNYAPKEYKSPDVKAYHINYDTDHISPRPDAFLGRKSGLDTGRPGILENGFEGLYDRSPRAMNLPPELNLHDRRPLVAKPPPELHYNSGLLNQGSESNSINDAYRYLGLTDPLKQDSIGPVSLVPPLALGPSTSGGSLSSPRVTFEDRNRSSGLIPPAEEELKERNKSKNQSYQVELQRQITENQMRKELDKVKKDAYDKKLEEEVKNFNPYGRGGGGAPMTDKLGNPVADLRKMHLANIDPTHRPDPSPRIPDVYVAPPSQQAASSGYDEETSHARGGHGIFGNPRTDAEKSAMDRYKDDLKRQIDEKKQREFIEKEKGRIEEEKENRRLEEQQRLIQSELEAERRKKAEKEEEARRKNDEMTRQADELKKEVERKRKLADEEKLQDLREQQERERLERQRVPSPPESPPVPALLKKRSAPYQVSMEKDRSLQSPPVPAVKSKIAVQTDEIDVEQTKPKSPLPTSRKNSITSVKSVRENRGLSPPVPATRTKAHTDVTPPSSRAEQQSRSTSADVLNHLATMRKQLQNERRRVENALENNKNEVDVYDPRLSSKPPAAPRRDGDNIDVFEIARNRAPAPVRRPTADFPNQRNIDDFNQLKYKGDTESRRAFRSIYPESAVTGAGLEAQQSAMLRQQEDRLNHLRQNSVYEQAFPHMQPKDLGLIRSTTISPQPLLESKSAFIDIEDSRHLPDDFEEIPRRNDYARQRRRDRIPSAPRADSVSLRTNPMGSTASLDIDGLNRRNEDRLKKLGTADDNVSLSNPDDILERFMAKQTHNRPPSGQTLQDDTWLQAGNG